MNTVFDISVLRSMSKSMLGHCKMILEKIVVALQLIQII
jgi:hypothetical protein